MGDRCPWSLANGDGVVAVGEVIMGKQPYNVRVNVIGECLMVETIGRNVIRVQNLLPFSPRYCIIRWVKAMRVVRENG